MSIYMSRQCARRTRPNRMIRYYIGMVLERLVLRLHAELFVSVQSAVRSIQVVRNPKEDNELLLARAIEAIDSLPKSVKSYLIRRNIGIVVILTAPYRMRCSRCIIIGNGIKHLNVEELKFMITRAVFYMRVRRQHRITSYSIARRNPSRIDQSVARLLKLEIANDD